jgi:hypothetical protein
MGENMDNGRSGKTYTLMGADRKSHKSETSGTYGGHRKTKVYGRMDCPTALRAIAKGGTNSC